jgi:malonyl-CoA/methylmalonyl-CoA synthetase
MVVEQARLIAPPADRPGGGVRFPDGTMTYAELYATAAATGLDGAQRVAVWAEPRLETCVAVVGALLAGIAVVPINPKLGPHELEHVIADSAPDVLLARADADLPAATAGVARVAVGLDGGPDRALPEPDPESDALVMYTSGTTGPPKGVVLSRGAVASNLDALARCWAWTGDDVLVHGLPLFHAHGLVLGTLGPLRVGGWLHHVGRFSVEAVTAELSAGASPPRPRRTRPWEPRSAARGSSSPVRRRWRFATTSASRRSRGRGSSNATASPRRS